jgi:hypothetical protein
LIGSLRNTLESKSFYTWLHLPSLVFIYIFMDENLLTF